MESLIITGWPLACRSCPYSVPHVLFHNTAVADWLTEVKRLKKHLLPIPSASGMAAVGAVPHSWEATTLLPDRQNSLD